MQLSKIADYEVKYMNVSAYTNHYASTGKNKGDPAYGIASSGKVARKGFVAAGRAYPIGTKMYIDGFGWLTVEDRGGAITDRHIDIWFESEKEALQFGRKDLKVWIKK